MHKLFELVNEIKKARFIWICGNGGSASTAEHFTTDLVKKGYPAICLNSNNSVLTMIANDYGYDKVFTKQFQVYANSEDLLVTLSCSGTSSNVVSVIQQARVLNVKHFEFETFDEIRDFGKLEDKHLAFAHEVAKTL